MNTHMIATGGPAPIPALPAAWLRLSAALTQQAPRLAGRDDLTVRCVPGAGYGAPGCFLPNLATIELDGTHLGHDPATCNPNRPSDRERYPSLWGVFVHETAHARHSHWPVHTTPPHTGPDGTARGPALSAQAAYQAAVMLEESRIEAITVQERPGSRRWLRASARQLILADFTTSTAPAAPGAQDGPGAVPQVAMTPWEAARAAALLLARVTAHVLDPDETTTLAAEVEQVLGSSRLGALSALWHQAHATKDDDHETMLDLGARWCRILGTDPDKPPPQLEGNNGPHNQSQDTREPSPLTAAITTTLEAVAASDAPAPQRPSKATRRRRAEQAARRRATTAAKDVFGLGPSSRPSGATATRGTRPPTPAEQTAARKLARHLRAAAHRERATTTLTSTTPPGRLNMRGALAAAAQRAAGATPTAEPFTRTVHRHVPAPPLRVGIACDISGSMKRVCAPVASAAWILAKATSHLPDATSATVIYGATVRPITRPGRTPARVTEFAARDCGHAIAKAIDALEAALDLTRPNAARLLVIVSDAHYSDEDHAAARQRITRLTQAGCGVLWLHPAADNPIPPGAQPLQLTNPAHTANAIGQAATRALRHT